jgi:hypothetical protein
MFGSVIIEYHEGDKMGCTTTNTCETGESSHKKGHSKSYDCGRRKRQVKVFAESTLGVKGIALGTGHDGICWEYFLSSYYQKMRHQLKVLSNDFKIFNFGFMVFQFILTFTNKNP